MDQILIVLFSIYALIGFSHGFDDPYTCRISTTYTDEATQPIKKDISCDFATTIADYHQFARWKTLLWNGRAASANLYGLGLDAVFDTGVANSLTTLEIREFQSEILKSNTFFYFPNLKMLNLTDNVFNMIAKDVFKVPVSLEKLTLSNNDVTEIDWKIFSRLVNLKSLTIQEPRIRRLNVNLTELVNLEVLQIRSVKNISKQTMDTIFKTGKLRALKRVEILNSEIESNFLLTINSKSLDRLQSLSLIGNSLKAIHFVLPGLQHLNLSHNVIMSEIYLGLFDMQALSVLDLRFNRLSTLHSRFCESCFQLKMLYLNNNRIHFIASVALSMLWNLELMELSSNRLECLQNGTLIHVKTIVVDDNPWDCRWLEMGVKEPSSSVFSRFKFVSVSDRINVKGLGCVVDVPVTSQTESQDLLSSVETTPKINSKDVENVEQSYWSIWLLFGSILLVVLLILLVWKFLRPLQRFEAVEMQVECTECQSYLPVQLRRPSQ